VMMTNKMSEAALLRAQKIMSALPMDAPHYETLRELCLRVAMGELELEAALVRIEQLKSGGS